MRAITEDEHHYDDPSPELLHILFTDMEARRSGFLIVERPADPSGQSYVQALRRSDGSYVVEHREGTPQSHVAQTAEGMDEAYRMVRLWAVGP